MDGNCIQLKTNEFRKIVPDFADNPVNFLPFAREFIEDIAQKGGIGSRHGIVTANSAGNN